MNTALNDLTNIIRHNQNQPRVYLARAEIYQKQGDITGAILNYSQVIPIWYGPVNLHVQEP